MVYYFTAFLSSGAGVITRRPLILQLIHVPRHKPEDSDNFDELHDKDAYFDASPSSSGRYCFVKYL